MHALTLLETRQILGQEMVGSKEPISVTLNTRHISNLKDGAKIDAKNGNTLLIDALRKEMSAVMVAFEVQLEETTHIPGYKQIPGHVVWGVKMDFTRKARYVAGGHRTDPPKSLTYSSVVSRESVWIAANDVGGAQ
jgi:hypothetical protein